MGREVRMVPPGWQHPTDTGGRYIPLLKQTRNNWLEEERQWNAGFVKDYKGGWKLKDDKSWHQGSYEDYAGELAGDRMPDFEPGTATHYCMYENTTEGTPISPAFATPEELARWLADNRASAFANMTASYEHWLATIRAGFAFDLTVSDGRMKSGVEYNGQKDTQ